MKLGIVKEITPGETRVAIIPETVAKLAKAKVEAIVEAGAGAKAFFDDAEYEKAGAKIATDAADVWAGADVVVKIHPPTMDESAGRRELDLLRPGMVLVAMLSPAAKPDLLAALAEAKVTSFSLDAVPRITRAQSMDVLSSMSTLAGYKAVLLAADALGKIMPMMMTAGGTIRPASALIIGAGVAGLQAIATARRLGAVVKAVDTRPPVKEQVESLGARFIPLQVEHEEAQTAGGYAKDLGEEFYKAEQEVLAPHVRDADIIITTALIPGRAAPLLITEAMVASMGRGSVIVDLAAPAGGNCTLTQPGKRIHRHGVTIVGAMNLPAELPLHASQMFSRNAAAFLSELLKEGQVRVDMENEIIREMLITHDGRIARQAAGGAEDSREVNP